MNDPFKDPDYITWLEDRHAEAVKAQDADAEREHQSITNYWLAKTQAEGKPPC